MADDPMTIAVAETDDQILATFDVMHQLRPKLARDSYLQLVRQIMDEEGYRLAAVSDDGDVRAVAGYRVLTMLYCGRILYVDDLVTDERVRSRGHGTKLLNWLKEEARRQNCQELQLISATHREHAHRFYFREGLGIECFHFRSKC